MATITASLLSASCMAIGFLVFTMSTLTPFDNIGVMTIKMISSTSMTSTIGVTLMSATGGGAARFFISLVAIVFSLGNRPKSTGAPREAPAFQLAGFPILVLNAYRSE